VINQIRAFLLERGITFRRGRKYLQLRMPLILEDAELNLSPLLRQMLDQLWQEWKALSSQIEATSQQIERIAEQDAACQRLQQIPGVGPLIASAMVAAVGNGSAFVKGRDFAACWAWSRDNTRPGKTKVARDQQTRQSLSEAPFHSWRAIDFHQTESRPTGAGHLDESTGTTDASQCGGRCGGEQAGADCLGGAGQGSGLSLACEILRG